MNRGRRWSKDRRQRGLFTNEAAPATMNPVLEARIKALKGLVAYPFDSPVVNSYDRRSIETIMAIVERHERLSPYWLTVVARLYGSYQAQGYIPDR